jgi:hypothetical protein
MVSGEANHSRLTQVVYPDGREVNYIYDSGIDNDISRLSRVTDSSSNTLESYSYMGLSTVVIRTRPEADIQLSYVKLSGEATAMVATSTQAWIALDASSTSAGCLMVPTISIATATRTTAAAIGSVARIWSIVHWMSFTPTMA